MNTSILWLLLLCIVCFGCETVSKDKLIISVAASTQFAVRHLAKDFEEEYNIPVEVVIGSSGKLTAQIMNGAPFDIFFSASTFYSDKLEQENKALEKPFIYGKGIPVIWSLDSTLDLKNIDEVLRSRKVQKVAIGNPQNAPFGKQAELYLKSIGVYNDIKSKLVYGESISQVNEYILSRSVQIGFSAKTILQAEKLKGRGHYISLDSNFHIPQTIVLLKNKRNNNESKKLFLRFVQSLKGKSILKKYGLL